MVVERDLVSAVELAGVGVGVGVGTGAGAGVELGGACTGSMARGQELKFCGSFLRSNKLRGGIKMHSVFEAILFRPMCISSPNVLKRELISSAPLIRSDLEVKKKAPSSTYRICRILKISPCAKPSLLSSCPNNWPDSFSMSSVDTLANSACGIPLLLHSVSKASANADIKNRKMTGDRLSPCLTPIVCGIDACSFPIFSSTCRSEYIRFTAARNFGGAP